MNKRAALIDAILPEYTTRHVFVFKLRVVAFLGFWAVYIYFMRDVLGQTKTVAAIVFSTFLITGLAYYNVIRGRMLILSFVVELLADLTALTSVLYLTGGPHSSYFTIYMLYVLTAGVLYNHYLAAIVALVSAAYYGLFLLLCHYGVIPPLLLYYGDRLPVPTYTPFAHFLMAAALLVLIVYTVKVSSYFSQRRERILERRNRELTALYRMGSTVRSAQALRDVIDDLLSGVLDGLGLEGAVMIRFDRDAGVARLHVPMTHPKNAVVEQILGRPIEGMEFPMDALASPVTQDIMRHRVIFRREVSELLMGLEGLISEEHSRKIKEALGFKRIVVVPIVVEKDTLGALICFSKEAYVGDAQLATMEAFANQSALSLEAALLIDRLTKLNEELKEANQVKSEFLATMSHELRTPLTAIIGFSELLTEGVMGEISDEQREALKEVLHNAADLLDMINSLLDLTKIESGRMKLDVRKFDIGEVMRRVSTTLAPLVQKKGQTMAVDVEKGIPPVSGDERKIQQAILNLMANANKFTPSQGRISAFTRFFRSWEDVKGRARWWQRFEGAEHMLDAGSLEIVVEDTGIGIPADHIDRIFDMFHQADGSSTRNFGGTGLGLALARRFIEMHGGQIWVESELGRGARFTVVIPLAFSD